MMAIVLGIEFFRPYLYGRRFVVRTDHRPLTWLRDSATTSGRLARWLIKVREYDIAIEFISGVDNVIADAFSRYFLEDRTSEEEDDDENDDMIVNNIVFVPTQRATGE